MTISAAEGLHQVLITEPAGQAHQRHGDGQLRGIRAQESRGRRIMLLKALSSGIPPTAPAAARPRPPGVHTPPDNEHDTED